MANHASAEKRNRQAIRRALANRRVLSAVRTAVKKARAALAGGDGGEAKQAVHKATVALAKAAGKGVLKARTASRATSRMEKALNQLQS
jgi:small subunit ribosomal protein S20